MRMSKDEYYLGIAAAVAARGTCLRRNFGAIIVKDDRVISTGYTGAPRGAANCIDNGECFRQKNNIPRGERYEMCKSVHAEQNAIIQANSSDMIDSTMYLIGMDFDGNILPDAAPCALCKRMIINAQIKEIIVLRENEPFKLYPNDWIKDGSLNNFGY